MRTPGLEASRLTDGRSLGDRLRGRTQALHTEAERSGYVAEILRGRAERSGYALLLRNLLPAYDALERRLDHAEAGSPLEPLCEPALRRTAAIESDLIAICGRRWPDDLPLLPAGARYARAVVDAGAGQGLRAVAHAYVRYLGDLSGGQILARLLGRSLALEPSALAFYRFAGDDVDRLKQRVRAAVELAGADPQDADAILGEAEHAFRLNIGLSQAVLAAVAPSPA